MEERGDGGEGGQVIRNSGAGNVSANFPPCRKAAEKDIIGDG